MNLIQKIKDKFKQADTYLEEIDQIGSSLGTGELKPKKAKREVPELKTTPKKELRPA